MSALPDRPLRLETYVAWMLHFIHRACRPSPYPVSVDEGHAYTHARSAAAAGLKILAAQEADRAQEY